MPPPPRHVRHICADDAPANRGTLFSDNQRRRSESGVGSPPDQVGIGPCALAAGRAPNTNSQRETVMRPTVITHQTLDGVMQSNGKPEPELNDGFVASDAMSRCTAARSSSLQFHDPPNVPLPWTSRPPRPRSQTQTWCSTGVSYGNRRAPAPVNDLPMAQCRSAGLGDQGPHLVG
jgi:hypothetical protein